MSSNLFSQMCSLQLLLRLPDNVENKKSCRIRKTSLPVRQSPCQHRSISASVARVAITTETPAPTLFEMYMLEPHRTAWRTSWTS